MKHSRRRFLKSAVALAVQPSCSLPEKEQQLSPERNPEPPPYQLSSEPDLSVFPFSLIVGDVFDDKALLRVHAEVSVVSLVLLRQFNDDWQEVKRFTQQHVSDGRLTMLMEDLTPDTAYSIYAVSVDERYSRVTRFRTALAPLQLRKLTFGMTSCLGGNYPWPNLSMAAAESFDFFGLLGDTVYADGGQTPAEYEAEWRFALNQKGFRDLLASTSIIATWDDHEVGNNWSWEQSGVEGKVEMALAAFKDALPLSEGGGDIGIWRKLSWGLVADIFVLDCRGERRDGNYISDEQLNWLMDGLASSLARFKLVFTSVPITDYNDLFYGVQAMDRWEGFPHQREALLERLEADGVSGVLWLAGDFHYGAVNRVGRPGSLGDGYYEVLCGPSGSFLNPLGDFIVDTDQFLFSFAKHHFTAFRLDPGTGTAEIRFIDDSGDVIQEVILDV